VASKEGRITSLDGKTGVQSWQWPSGLPTAQILTTPVVADGTLYALQTTGQLFALEAATGVQSWSFTATQGQ